MTRTKPLLNLLNISFLFFYCSLLHAEKRLRIFIIDSSYKYESHGEIGIEFKKSANRSRYTYNSGGGMGFEYFDFECINCQIDNYGVFKFDRTELYRKQLNPIIVVSRKKGKYRDTLEVGVLRPTEIRMVNYDQLLKPQRILSPEFAIRFEDGRELYSSTSPFLWNYINIGNFPAGVQFKSRQIELVGTNYYRSVPIRYQVVGLDSVKGFTRLKTQYVYHLNVSGNGVDGEKGLDGNRGGNGSNYNNRCNPNGEGGEPGGHGQMGGNGQNLTVNVRYMDSGVFMVSVPLNGVQAMYFVDLNQGGEMTINVNGGNGGNGGSGGGGGCGADGKEDTSPGFGGHGGSGGHGGPGGNGGTVVLYIDSATYRYIAQIHITNLGGRGGYGGQGGNGGAGGSNYNSSLLQTLFTGRSGTSGVDGQNGMNGQNGIPYQIIIVK